MGKPERMWVIRLVGERGGIVHSMIAKSRREVIRMFCEGETKPWREWSVPHGSYEAVAVWCTRERKRD
jgi:hypothetical protein